MKSVLKIFIIAAMISFPLSLKSQVKIDLKKQVITIDKNAKANVKKEVTKNQTSNQDQSKQNSTTSQDKKDPKSVEAVDLKSADTDNIGKEPLEAYSKYDFIPGDKVLLYEDFSQDAVGDFPALWTTDVSGEINSLNIAPGNWFNLKSTEGTYWFLQDIEFPKNFILEMDIVPKKEGGRYAADIVLFGETVHSEMDKAGDPGVCGLHIKIEKNCWETVGYKKGVTEKLSGYSALNLVDPDKLNHVIVWVQNRRVRIYHKGGKVLDIPTNIFDGSKFNRMCLKLYRGASCGSYVTNIKITTAAPDMRNKLLTEGKLISYGIYFDVSKDVVKPESYGTLKEIAAVMTENPEVRVKIVGHTDSDGADPANLDLSKRRGSSVKAELIKNFGIDGSRLESDGLGETQPVAQNDTPSNKALNRRVEFIKL